MLISMCVIHAVHHTPVMASLHTETCLFFLSFFLSFSRRVFSCLPFYLMRFSDISRSFRYSHFFSSKKRLYNSFAVTHTHTERERERESGGKFNRNGRSSQERETEESGWKCHGWREFDGERALCLYSLFVSSSFSFMRFISFCASCVASSIVFV